MRAVVCEEFGPFENMVVRDWPTPEPGPGEVRIDIKAIGVGFAQSLLVAGKYQIKPERPFIPGVDACGVISALGPDVSGVAIGDRVCTAVFGGAFAEHSVVPDFTCHALPDGMPFDEGVLLATTYATSYGALVWSGRLQAGETVLVHGAAGAIGLAAVEIAKAKGAKVIGTAGTDEKCAAIRKHGADLAINYQTDDFVSAVKAWTDGHGADVVIDPVGGDVSEPSLRAMAHGARMVTLGYAAGSIPRLPINFLLLKNMTVTGLNIGTYLGWPPFNAGRQHLTKVRALYDDLRAMYVAGQLKPPVSHRFPLEQFNDAMETVLSRRSIGKVILEP